jgi:hypothetical protein
VRPARSGGAPIADDLSRLAGNGEAVVELGELVMILDLHRQGHDHTEASMTLIGGLQSRRAR